MTWVSNAQIVLNLQDTEYGMAEMKTRNTFTAISLHMRSACAESGGTICIAPVNNGDIGRCEMFRFLPWSRNSKRHGELPFVDVFKRIESCIANHNLPVVGWGRKNRDILSGLIDKYDIDIPYPIRYFDLEDYARRRMRDDRMVDDWRVVATRLNVDICGQKYPEATDCAKIFLALEATDYQLIVARAFLAFIKSIMDDDNRIDTFEAKGLQAFLSMLTSNFEQFNELRAIVDETLADDVIEPHESDLLMDKLGAMRRQYQDYVDSCDRK